MQRRLGDLGLEYDFIRAIDGSAGEHVVFSNYRDEFCIKSWCRPLTSGEIGCFASHYLLWQRCVSNNEPMIVMEDDVDMSPQLVEVIRLLPGLSDLGYVRLAGTAARPFRIVPRNLPAGWKLVRYLQGPMGTQCYVLYPKGALRLLGKADTWRLPVDDYIDSFWTHGVPCLGLLPAAVSVKEGIESTISSGGLSPSALMRDRVWRPKRFIARNVGDIRRRWANLEYAVGLKSAVEGKNVAP